MSLATSKRIRDKKNTNDVELQTVDAFTIIDDSFDTIKQTENMLNPDISATIYTRLKQLRELPDDGDFSTIITKDIVDERGAAKEHLLHLCLLPADKGKLNPKLRRAALWIIEHFPQLINEPYQSQEYAGEVPLHMAIVADDLDVVKVLVKAGAKVNNVETKGTFFQPHSKGGKVYFGGTPLNFAVSNSDSSSAIVDYLLQNGANINGVDLYGNGVLHMCVLYPNPSLYDHLKSLGANPDLKNNEDEDTQYTPLTLAAAIGKEQMFNHILESDKRPLWSYGPVSVNLYPPNQLDECVEIIRHFSHRELLTNKVVWTWLVNKWNAFGRRAFWRVMIAGILYLAIYFLAISLRPKMYTERIDAVTGLVTYEQTFKSIYDEDKTPREWARYGLECAIVLFNLGYILAQMRALYKWGWLKYVKYVGAFQIFSGWGHVILYFLSLGLRFVQWRDFDRSVLLRLALAEDVVLSGASLVAWLHLISFYRGFQALGQFGVLLYRMFFIDVGRFTAIYVIVLLGFSQVFYLLFPFESASTALADDPNLSYATMSRSAITLFLASFGDFHFESYSQLLLFDYPRGVAATLFLVLYVTVVTLLMLNLLIAMMNHTYKAIARQAELEWRMQWAGVVQYLTTAYSEEDWKSSPKKLHIVSERDTANPNKPKKLWMVVEEVRRD